MKGTTDTIDAHGDPLAFKVRQGSRKPAAPEDDPAERVFKVEARQMAGHQKEAVVTQGEVGSAWRLASDEGAHLRGTDLAPFPLGFFNAGLQSDLYRHLRYHAKRNGVTFDSVDIRLENRYWLTGSFALGTGEGHAEPTRIKLSIGSPAPARELRRVVEEALASSPAIALLRTPLENTFALYVNGRRRRVEGVPNSAAGDASDPYLAYSAAPRPLPDAVVLPDPITKTGRREGGSPVPAPASTDTRVVRIIKGEGRPIPPDGCFEVETWLEMPGASHFAFRTDEGDSDLAPSGLALLSAAVSFCYMTQLSRYIEHMRLAIKGVRLVQYSPYRLMSAAGRMVGVAGPIDTHLFLNGDAPEETHAKLLSIAARTCYLHATAAAALEPVVRIVHNDCVLTEEGNP